MNKETIVTSAFCVHHSKFSCSLAAALLDGLFEQSAVLLEPSVTSSSPGLLGSTIVFQHLLDTSPFLHDLQSHRCAFLPIR
jgi:hypothetical protein